MHPSPIAQPWGISILAAGSSIAGMREASLVLSVLDMLEETMPWVPKLWCLKKFQRGCEATQPYTYPINPTLSVAIFLGWGHEGFSNQKGGGDAEKFGNHCSVQ